MNHEGRWLRIFQLNRKESTHSEKITKGKQPKGGSENEHIKALGRED